MKRILYFIPLVFMFLPLFPQKADIRVVRVAGKSVSEWEILDEKFLPVFNGNEYFRHDTIDFTLEANKRYFFLVSVSETDPQDTSLYSLAINGEPVILVDSGQGTGDHYLPFFTGIKADYQSKITGGSDTDISDFTWQVFIEADDFTCGGAIISENWIITAAHCTKDDYNHTISASDIDVIVGANNPRSSTEGKKYYVSQVIVHEDFNNRTLDNDIALLKLSEPVNYTNATPIKLVSSIDAESGAIDPGVMSWVTGYGLINVSPATYPATLQKVQLPIVSNTQASVAWDDIPATDLMAGYLNGNKDACMGDSGGPLVVPVSGRQKLAGLVSWGSSKCNTYGAYTRVSDFQSWITAETGIEISFTAPVPSGDSIICHGVETSEYNVNEVSGATGYQWQLSNESAGTITTDSNHAVVKWAPGFTGATYLRLRVTRTSDISEWSELHINVVKNTKITGQSKDTVLCAELAFNLQIESEGYNQQFSWYFDGNQIETGNSSVLSFPGLSGEDSGVYYCSIKGSCGSVRSDDISLTVLPVTVITDISGDTETAFGANAELGVTAEGHLLSYQWQKDDSLLDNGNLRILNLQDVNSKDIGLYNVVVKGTCGTVSSDRIYFYVKKQDFTEDPEVSVWPSPASYEINVALSNNQYYNILVTTVTGKLILQKSRCRYQTNIPVISYEPGIYIITVYNSSFRKSIKVIRTG
jgi:hypothetical protein